MKPGTRRRLNWLVATAVGFGAPALGRGGSVTLIASEDATIAEQDPSSVFGADTMIKAGTTGPIEGTMKNRALLKFDFTGSIPESAVVTSAALTLTVVQTPPTTTSLPFHLHKVGPAWSEGAVSWTNRLSASPAVLWSTPGGAPPLDFGPTPTQSTLVTGTGAFVFASNPGMVADVQDWVGHPPANSGWILLCDLEDLERSVRKFGSSEAGNPAARPALTVEFTLPAPPPVVSVLPPMDGRFQFDFIAEAGTGYIVEYSADLGASHWFELTTLPPPPAPENRRISDPLVPGASRFYRVRPRS